MRGVRSTSTYLVFIALLSLLAATPGFGQEATATMGGIVKDPSGASIAGAAVTLTNSKTGISREARTGTDGAYLFTLVPIGTYSV